MKKSFLTTLLMFSCFFVIGQQVNYKNIASLTIPKGVSKVYNDHTIPNNNDQTNRMQNKFIKSSRGDKFIGNGGIKFLQVHGAIVSTPENYLNKTKKGMDATENIGASKDRRYSSIIKKYNNYEALILKSRFEKYVKYIVISVNKSHTRVITSTVIIDDKVEGEEIVNDFVASIKFK